MGPQKTKHLIKLLAEVTKEMMEDLERLVKAWVCMLATTIADIHDQFAT